jgi:prevent-host-death family protein
MCYMKKRNSARVGVRELRQSLSVYLRRVADGETLQVTEHGRPVAILAPLPPAATPLERLIAAGRVTAPRGDLLELGPPRGRVSRRASAALQELRADRL